VQDFNVDLQPEFSLKQSSISLGHLIARQESKSVGSLIV